jgi:photosystem II stability/assembly factor-like uncharacterized protein
MKKLLFACFFFLPVFAFSQEEWELIHGSDENSLVSNVFIVDSAHLWGQFDHSFYFSDDFGETWTQQFDYDTNNFISTYFVDTLNGWACGKAQVIHTEDGGENWEYQTLPHDWWLSVTSVFFLNPDTGWVAGSYMTIFVTYDGGDNWTMQHESIGSSAFFLNDIHFHDALHGCAVGGGVISFNPIVMTTSDGGETWSDIIPPSDEKLLEVQFVNDFVVWAIDMDERLFRSNDQGYSWEVAILFPYYFNPGQMHFFNETDAIIADPMSIELAFTEDAWNSYWYDTIFSYNHFDKFSFASDRKGIASGRDNLLRTRNGGNTWERLNERFVRIAFFDLFNGWIIPEYLNKKLLHTIDGGLTWFEVETGHSGMIKQMDFVNDHLGYVLTREPELLKTTDAGNSWEIIGLPFDPSFYFSDIQFLDENTGFISAYPNRLYKTLDGGINWDYDTLLMTNIWAVDFIDASEGWAVDRMGHIAHTSDGGSNWNYSSFSQNYLFDVDFVNPLDGFVLTSSLLYKTEDGGNNWQEIHYDGSFSRSLHFADELNGWIICEDEVYRTYDGGLTWDVVVENTSANLQHEFTGFFALDTGNAWVCSMDGRVLSCTDFVGIEEDELVSDINIYPNPVSDLLSIETDESIKEDLTLHLYSIDGKLLMKENVSEEHDGPVILDLTDLSRGIYFLNVKGITISRGFKVVKH